MFSSGDEIFDSKDYIKYYTFMEDPINAKKILGEDRFKRVPAYRYGMIMLLYRARNRMGGLYLFSIKDLEKEYSDEIIELSKKEGFCSSGFLIKCCGKLYLLAHIKSTEYVYKKKFSAFGNAVESLDSPYNKNICLFEVKLADPSVITDMEYSDLSYKIFPPFFRELHFNWAYKLLAFGLFALQFVVAFLLEDRFSKRRKRKKID